MIEFFAAMAASIMVATTRPEVYMIEESCSYSVYDNGIYRELTQDDIDIMARCVMSEAGGQSDECKEAVATTIINRWMSPRYSNSIPVIIEDAYSTADNGPVTSECYLAVYSAIAWWGSDFAVLPRSIYYFRADHYHEWALDYRQIDDLYFSAPTDAVFD